MECKAIIKHTQNQNMYTHTCISLGYGVMSYNVLCGLFWCCSATISTSVLDLALRDFPSQFPSSHIFPMLSSKNQISQRSFYASRGAIRLALARAMQEHNFNWRQLFWVLQMAIQMWWFLVSRGKFCSSYKLMIMNMIVVLESEINGVINGWLMVD